MHAASLIKPRLFETLTAGGGGVCTAAQGLTAADVTRAALTGAYVARRPSVEAEPPAGMLKPLSTDTAHRVTLTQWLMLHQHHVSFCVCVGGGGVRVVLKQANSKIAKMQ